MDNQISTSLDDRIKAALESIGNHNLEPEYITRKVLRILDYAKNKEQDADKLSRVEQDVLNIFGHVYEFDKHFNLAESVGDHMAPMAIKMTQDLIKEHNCKTIQEKSLVEIIVNAFCRSLGLSRRLMHCMSGDSVKISSDHTNYYNFLSKEIDKANRQYLTALTTLQQLKSPSLKVTLKAETAIVGQNQQFNSIATPQDENNKTN